MEKVGRSWAWNSRAEKWPHSGPDGDTPAKMAPIPSHNVSPPQLKPEARPFYLHQNNTAPHRLTSQQPLIHAKQYVHEPLNRMYEDVYPPRVKFNGEHATPVHHSRTHISHLILSKLFYECLGAIGVFRIWRVNLHPNWLATFSKMSEHWCSLPAPLLQKVN